MDEALLDTDILSEVLKQRHPIVGQKAAHYLKTHGRFALSALRDSRLYAASRKKMQSANYSGSKVFANVH